MSYPEIIARLSHFSFRVIEKSYNLLDAILTGFWLGVMGDKSLDAADKLYYKMAKSYINEDYNTSGLFNWEKIMIEKYFSNARDILLIAAGGGREVLALIQMGYNVDSYECNPQLAYFANTLLKKNGIQNQIQPLSRNNVPEKIKKYDGIIIGWGAYTLIRGKTNRLSFMTNLKPFLKDQAPLMISFLTMKRISRKDRVIIGVANFLRLFWTTQKREFGDRLIHEFVHFFQKNEILKELNQAKFNCRDYYDTEYGCAIAQEV